MNKKKIKFEDTKSFSKLFLDYISGNFFINERFPLNNKLFDSKELLEARAENFKKRMELTDVIKTSMNNIEINTIQKENLKCLLENNSLTIVTGQQVGFLGGPLYTIFKAISAVKLSEKLNKQYGDLKFVPVFWVEDNDHDNFEASHISIYNKNYELIHLNCCPDCVKTDRTIVAEKYFDDNINEIIILIENHLPGSEYKSEILKLLKEIYIPGKSWCNAFVEFLNHLLSKTGILYLRASKARESGLQSELAKKELEHPGMTDYIIREANDIIKSNNYHIQAKSSFINLFFQNGVKREKIEHVPENMEQGMGRNEQESRTENLESDIFTKKFKVGDKILNYNELLKIADDQKSTFSPNVLLRPVFQDSILPNAAYIAGPGEIGYSLQIKDLYDYFDVPMPAFISRHSATFLDRRTVRFFETHSTQEKQETEIGNREIINDNNSQFQIPNSKHLKPELSYTYFMRDFGDISKELTSEIINKDVESHLKEIEGQFHELYVKLAGIASEIDKSLDGTVKSTEQKSMQSYEHIIKKIISAQKKRNSEIFEKYEQTYNLIFPSKTLQERIYSPLNIINYIGIEAFIDFLLQIFEDDYKEHFIIGL